MSCWVVPTLAAELWQMPLELLLRFIRDGKVTSKQEDGFTFVDMAPGGPKLVRPMTPPHLRPPTYTLAKSDDVPAPPPPIEQSHDSNEEPEREPEEGFEDETASTELGDWRTARRKNSRLRVPPAKRA